MAIDWLSDDLVILNALLVVAASSLAVAVACRLRRHVDDFRSAALASLHWSVVHTVESTVQGPSLVVPTPAAQDKERKSTRSKERRRRGKDPLRDLFKGGKKSKALLKAIEGTDHDHAPHSLSNPSLPHNGSASSTSRSRSPGPATDTVRVESDDGSVRSTTPNGNSSSASAVTSDRDIAESPSSPPESITAADMQDAISSASTISPDPPRDALSSPPVSTDIRTPQPRDSQAAYTSETCAKLVRARTRLRLSRMDPTTKSSLLLSTPSPLPDSVAHPFHSIYTPPPPVSSTHATDVNGPSTPTVSRGSTPPSRSLSSEDLSLSESLAQPVDQSTAIELASMRNALEAAHLREEHLRAEAEQASKEREELRWGWNENAMGWRRREAELQAQIHHLMQQLQAYAAMASFQATSSFSPPTSPCAHSSPRVQQHPLASFPPPPAIQTRNSASAPAHVQALLASAPMLTSHPPGYAAYPRPGFGMSPLLWSGLGLCVPNQDARHGRRTPDSSASGSSSRGRGRRRHGENPQNASDESSQGDWDGIEGGSGDEDLWEEKEDDIFSNNALADAILKRPESIRELSRVGKRSRPPMQGAVGERKDALKDPAPEQPSVVVDAPADW